MARVISAKEQRQTRRYCDVGVCSFGVCRGREGLSVVFPRCLLFYKGFPSRPRLGLELPVSPDNPCGIAPAYSSYPGHPTEFSRAHGDPMRLKIMPACLPTKAAPTCFFNVAAHSNTFWEGIWGLTRNSTLSKSQLKFNMILSKWPLYIWFGFCCCCCYYVFFPPKAYHPG